MKRVFILVGIMFLLTGCTASYDVEIKKDLTVTETASVIGDDRYKVGYLSLQELYEGMKENYIKFYNSESPEATKSFADEKKNSSAEYSKTYKNIEDYINSFYLKSMFSEGTKLTTEKSIVKIQSFGFFRGMELFQEGVDEDAPIEELKVKIKVPYVIAKHNADEYDEKTNTLTYKFNYSSFYKTLELSFDKDQEFKAPGIDILKIVFTVLGFGVAGIIGYFIYKKMYAKSKKNNKI